MTITEITTAAQPAIVIRRTSALGSPEMAAHIDSGYAALWGYLAQHNLTPAGAPFLWTLDMRDGTIEYDLGIPVAGPVPEAGDVRFAELPAGQAATMIHEGSYETLSDSYGALQAWIQAHGRHGTGGPWEIYLTDPRETPDVKDWRTQLVMPIA